MRLYGVKKKRWAFGIMLLLSVRESFSIVESLDFEGKWFFRRNAATFWNSNMSLFPSCPV